jgi:hypothetical protein
MEEGCCNYWEGQESLNDFPAWSFERYLLEVEKTVEPASTYGDRVEHECPNDNLARGQREL